MKANIYFFLTCILLMSAINASSFGTHDGAGVFYLVDCTYSIPAPIIVASPIGPFFHYMQIGWYEAVPANEWVPVNWTCSDTREMTLEEWVKPPYTSCNVTSYATQPPSWKILTIELDEDAAEHPLGTEVGRAKFGTDDQFKCFKDANVTRVYPECKGRFYCTH